MTTEDLVQLVTLLNPEKEEGKLTIITRYGAAKVLTKMVLSILTRRLG